METKRLSHLVDHALLGDGAARQRAMVEGVVDLVANTGVSPQILAVLDSLPVLVSALDLRHRQVITYWNRECEAVSGYASEELVNHPEALQWLYPEPLYLARKTADFQELGAHFRDLEWTLTTKSGEKRRIAWSTIDGLPAGPGQHAVWCVGLDVTARSESDRLLRDRDKLLGSVFRHLPDMVYLKDGEGRWLLTNPAARAVLGLSEQEAYGYTNLEIADRNHPQGESLRQSALTDEATWQSGRASHMQEVADDGQGNLRWLDVIRVPTFGRRGQRLHLLIVRRDITDQRIAATKLELAGRVLEQSTDGIIVTDEQNRIIMVNGAFTEITGYQSHEVLGRDPQILASGQHDPSFFQHMWKVLAEEGRWAGEIWNRRKNGEVYPQWMSLSALHQRAHGEVTHYVAAFSDLSSRKAAEEKIAYLSSQDVITGLPNRAHVALRSTLVLKHAKTTHEQVAMIVIDVDNFKTLNDSLGHAAGDQMLREVGQRLSQFADERSVVGRLSGDEFLILLRNVQGTADAAHMVTALMDAVGQPMVLADMPVNVSISAGIAMFPADGDQFDALFGRADSALYAAKRGGRGTYQFANATMNEVALERLRLESALRLAIENNALRLEYQPLIHLPSGRVVGTEALCRWDHPERGPIPPSLFIPIAEDCGLIEALGGWVLKTAALQLRAWHDAGQPELMMAVNLSARQFQRGVVLRQVEEALAVSGIAPDRLELELTESVLLHDGEAVTAVLRRLQALGVKLSIDDFGTGYSSFAYLRRIKFDKIKIDQSFVRDLIDDPDNAAIVRGIISLALSLGLRVLAEGVETEETAQRLRHLQCTYAQGYHFARPLRPEVFALQQGLTVAPLPF
ncbi:PAS domain S-box-containing protein/diguanylate cyclase (GGDEF) domain-containing protein [Rhodoferax sp. OV413]|uniref:bifunctional diguanylate cyclase/phosphodiesterase n=1 Tax=Rhodoferax sp. OV413 TaxID=1855285 RepID=UPI00087E5C2A|nr:bifunctional diguanylate cyclase/phosphodiesterase [Rhodoferax sp. OV413]SDP09369.1 PAS domain S-box-containing protein/diguanylate cyclase (GGDEF) domain-containing protein [Rhodoferax sp. OV413]